MFAWLMVVVGIVGAEAEPPPVRSFALREPMLLWEHGAAIIWSSTADPRHPESGPVLGAPLHGPETNRSVSVTLPDGAFVVLGTLDGELHRLHGPQTILFAAPENSGSPVRMTLSDMPDDSGHRVATLDHRFATGRHGRPAIIRSPSNEAQGRNGATLLLTSPRARVVRPDPDEPLVIAWNTSEGDTRRFDLEIAEIGGDGNNLATLERWWRVRGPTFRTWRSLPPGRRFRITLEEATHKAPAGRERAEFAVETISDDERAQVDGVMHALEGASDVVGVEAVAVFQAIVLASFGLDSEAAGRWTHLFALHPTHPRAPEIAAHALAALP